MSTIRLPDITGRCRGAVFSRDRRHRYLLWRRLAGGAGAMLVIALNPSSADETMDDSTVRRCIGFARQWGFPLLYVANLFAFRATRPRDLHRAANPRGADNRRWLTLLAAEVDFTLAAWGNGGRWRQADLDILPELRQPYCLGLTRHGAPLHPLRVPRRERPLPYCWRSALASH
jgi:hypothetical protein